MEDQLCWVYSVWMFKNIGTIEAPYLQWVLEARYYYGEKQLTDFDLHDVPGLREDAKFIGRQILIIKN